MQAWMNGRMVDAAEARVPILSPSFGRGTAVFELLDVIPAPERTAVFRVDAHIARLRQSAELLHMALPGSDADLARAVLETVRANGVRRGVVKVFAYFGEPDFGLVPRNPRVDVAMICADFQTAYGKPQAQLATPAAVMISPIRKLDSRTVQVHAKATGNYVNAYLARWDAMQKGCGDAILLDCNGHVAEGSLSNVFIVRDGVVLTPSLDAALAGITRDTVMDLVRGMGLPLREASFDVAALLAADEMFLTGSTIHVRAVRTVDGAAVGGACPGPVTRRVVDAYESACEGRDTRYSRWLTYVE